jgi:hypothetical protein
MDQILDGFSRFARFEHWLVGREPVLLRVTRPAGRYRGLDRPAYLRRQHLGGRR